MNRAIRNRLLMLIPAVVGVTVLVFLILELAPRDSVPVISGPDVTSEHHQQSGIEMDMDSPWPIRYVVWLGQVMSGNLGYSSSLGRPVAELVLSALGPTLLLVGMALALGSLVGLTAGLATGRHRHSPGRQMFGLLVLFGVSMPSFLLGWLLILIFAVWLGWFPVSGMLSSFGGDGPLDLLMHLILPTLSLTLVAAGVIAGKAREAALEVWRQEHVRLAPLRGMGARRIGSVHVFRGVLSRLVPLISRQAGFLIGGGVYVETIFQWPGLGRLLAEAVVVRDIPLVQGGILVLSLVYLLIALLADLARYRLDPRTVPL